MNKWPFDFSKEDIEAISSNYPSSLGELMESAEKREKEEKEKNKEFIERRNAVELEENNWEKTQFSYWNINFDLQRRTLELGVFSGPFSWNSW